MSKNRRARLARGIQHLLGVGDKLHTNLAHDPEWLLGQLKAAVRVAREMDYVLAIYEEDFHQDIADAVKEALYADDQSACA